MMDILEMAISYGCHPLRRRFRIAQIKWKLLNGEKIEFYLVL